jgi:hypothetical protein
LLDVLNTVHEISAERTDTTDVFTLSKIYQGLVLNAKNNQDTRTPEDLLDLIEAKGREVAEALAALRKRNE